MLGMSAQGWPLRLRCYFEHGSDALESKECLIRSSVEVACRVSDQACEWSRTIRAPVEAVQHSELPSATYFKDGSVISGSATGLSREIQIAGGVNG